MSRHVSIAQRYYRLRSQYWRAKRLLFPSPAEVRFMQLMGAHILTPHIYKLRPINKNGFPLCIVISRGKILRQAKLRREVRIGRCYVDFANDLNWIIEIDGTPYHQDVVADFDREVYMREYLRKQKKDLRILRVPAPRLWHARARVQRDVIAFLNT